MAQSLCRIFISGMADGGGSLADAVCSSLSAAGALGLWTGLSAQQSKIGTDGNFDAPQNYHSYAGLETA